MVSCACITTPNACKCQHNLNDGKYDDQGKNGQHNILLLCILDFDVFIHKLRKAQLEACSFDVFATH